MDKDAHLIFEQYLKESPPPVYHGDVPPDHDFYTGMDDESRHMLTGPKPKHGHAKVKGDAPPEGEEMISTDVMRSTCDRSPK